MARRNYGLGEILKKFDQVIFDTSALSFELECGTTYYEIKKRDSRRGVHCRSDFKSRVHYLETIDHLLRNSDNFLVTPRVYKEFTDFKLVLNTNNTRDLKKVVQRIINNFSIIIVPFSKYLPKLQNNGFEKENLSVTDMNLIAAEYYYHKKNKKAAIITNDLKLLKFHEMFRREYLRIPRNEHNSFVSYTLLGRKKILSRYQLFNSI